MPWMSFGAMPGLNLWPEVSELWMVEEQVKSWLGVSTNFGILKLFDNNTSISRIHDREIGTLVSLQEDLILPPAQITANSRYSKSTRFAVR